MTKEERIVLYNRVFGTDEGKMVLDDLMKFCGVDKVSADFGNPNVTYYREGGRAVGINIKTILNKKEIQNVRVKQ
jgi:hypothetical protein